MGCRFCVYWKEDVNNVSNGLFGIKRPGVCRRYPKEEDVCGDNYCGELKPKDPYIMNHMHEDIKKYYDWFRSEKSDLVKVKKILKLRNKQLKDLRRKNNCND